MDSLKTLQENHQGKVSDKWTRYLEDYDPILTPYRNQAINLLEIGVQNGGSLEVWSKYFPEATHIIGCDIDEKCQDLHYEDPRIQVIIGDAGTEATKQQILTIVPTFDIIIDDGSHTSGDIVRNFAHYFDRLNDNGTFIIEDLHCSYWQEFDGGLYHPYSAINFLKNLADIVNHEHWGLPMRNSETLEEICQHYNVIAPNSLAHIHSVEFINSVCIIKKRAIAENELGSRIIVGQEVLVAPNRERDNNTRSVAPIQSETPYPHSAQTIITNLLAQLASMQQSLETAQLQHQQDEQTLQTQLVQLEQLAQLENELVTTQKQLAHLEKNKFEGAQKTAALKKELQAAQNQLNTNIQQQQENQNLQEHIAGLDNRIASLNNHITGLHQHINNLETSTKRITKLWTFRLLKPLFKTEQAISSANRYRKKFALLVHEKGSIGKAYQFLRKMRKHSGVRVTKQFLKNYSLPVTIEIQPSSIEPELSLLPKYQSRYEVQATKFIERTHVSLNNTQKDVKVICFYLPQFHPFPENDAWWGKGFTEWTNVKPALPQYKGHYQPHIPHKFIGYYSLLDKETQLKQIELAKQYGIEGFCYYLYWFSGHRLMETPLDNMLADKEIDFPFCVCWANENWTRRWDGLDQDILIAQDYSEADDIEFIKNIAKYLKDPRYIHINGKPLLIIYRPNLFPDMRETAQRWRTWCRKNGIGEIYLAYPQSFEIKNPNEYGFDAAIEFPPNNSAPPMITETVQPNADFEGNIYDWRILLEHSDNYTKMNYTLFRGANPSWDNTARKKNKGIIFENSSPELFEKYLVNALSETIIQQPNKDERLVFVNAWNEWAEGAHLEPDQKYGFAWLQAVQNAHLLTSKLQTTKVGVVIHAFYPDVLQEALNDLAWTHEFNQLKLYVTTPFEKENEVKQILENSDFEYQLLPCKNLGRDILPFIKLLPLLKKDNVEFFLKIHTKRSLHRVDGDQWRQYLYKQLLSKSGFIHAISALIQNDKIAFIAPDKHIATLSNYWGSNEKVFKNFCKKSGSPFNKNRSYQFVAGSMFYARTEIFDYIINLNLTDADFDEEKGQIDGTLAHTLERYFGVLAAEKGYYIEEINLSTHDECSFPVFC